MATKLGRIVTYLDGLLTIESHDPLITWSCEITWKSNITISPLPQSLYLPNLARWRLVMRDFYSCYSILWSCGLARSGNKLKLLYLHYHSILATKFGRMETLPIKSNDHTITRFSEIR